MEWIRAANLSKFDLFTAFNDLHTLDWTKGPFKVQTGDIVFLCISAPYSKIMLKTRCIKDDVGPDDTIDDHQYWSNPDEFSKSTEYIRLELISELDDERLSVETLNQKDLINGRVQGAIRDTGREALFEYINSIFDEKINISLITDIGDVSILSETEKKQIIKGRIGQGKYRDDLLKLHSGKCMICGMGVKELLIASHIKEWSDATNSERLDKENGLLLCALHDSVFDKHMISFDDDGNMLISKKLSIRDSMLLNLNSKYHISLTERMKKYMRYHRGKFEEKSDS